MNEQERFTRGNVRKRLEAARADIAMLLSRKHEEQAELYRLLSITGELYEGILGEDAPEYRVEVRAS